MKAEAARWNQVLHSLGAIAFSRTGDTALGDFEDAVILKTVGGMAMTNRQDEIDEIERCCLGTRRTLSAQDAQRVEDALARRPELQASLRLAREDRGEAIALNERLGAPSANAWEKVLCGVHEAPRRSSYSRKAPRF